MEGGDSPLLSGGLPLTTGDEPMLSGLADQALAASGDIYNFGGLVLLLRRMNEAQFRLFRAACVWSALVSARRAAPLAGDSALASRSLGLVEGWLQGDRAATLQALRQAAARCGSGPDKAMNAAAYAAHAAAFACVPGEHPLSTAVVGSLAYREAIKARWWAAAPAAQRRPWTPGQARERFDEHSTQLQIVGEQATIWAFTWMVEAAEAILRHPHMIPPIIDWETQFSE